MNRGTPTTNPKYTHALAPLFWKVRSKDRSLPYSHRTEKAEIGTLRPSSQPELSVTLRLPLGAVTTRTI